MSLREDCDETTAAQWLWETSGGYGHDQPGSSLLQYGMGTMADGSRNPSVIYATYLRNGVSTPPADRVAAWLTSGGINRLVVGHQPNGDSPWIINKYFHSGNSKHSISNRFQVYRANALK